MASVAPCLLLAAVVGLQIDALLGATHSRKGFGGRARGDNSDV